MATYADLATIRAQAGFGQLVEKIRVAVVIKAVAYLDDATPTAGQVAWAQRALQDPAATAESVTWYVIGKNSAATVAQILGANDSAVQSNVDAAVIKIVAGGL